MIRMSSLALLLALIFSTPVMAQDTEVIEVGDLLKIEAAQNYEYSHVQFPRPNFIIKKGGIANYKKLNGTIVKVTKVTKDEKGESIIKLKRRDGKKFFGSFPVVMANYDKALASKELSKMKSPN